MMMRILHSLVGMVMVGWMLDVSSGWVNSIPKPMVYNQWLYCCSNEITVVLSSRRKVMEEDDDVYFPGRLVKASSYSRYRNNQDKVEEVYYRLGQVIRCQDYFNMEGGYPDTSTTSSSSSQWMYVEDSSDDYLVPYKYFPQEDESTGIIDQLGRPWKSAQELQQVGLYRNDLPSDTTLLMQTITITENNTTMTVPLPWDSTSTTNQHHRYKLPSKVDFYDDDEEEEEDEASFSSSSPLFNSMDNTIAINSNSGSRKLRKRSSSASSSSTRQSTKNDKNSNDDDDNVNTSNGSRFELDDERWLSHYNNLVQFKSIHGHVNVPKYFTEDPTLGRWVNRQRSYYATYVRNKYYTHNYTISTDQTTGEKEVVFGKKLIPLTQWRIQMLYDLGFQFQPNKKESWYSRFQQLKSFYSSDKSSNNEMQYSHPRLYEWMTIQRTEYRKETLSKKQIKLLNSLKPQFDWDPQQSAWDFRIQQFANSISNNQNDNNNSTSIQDASLKQWLVEQRYQYKLYHSDTSWESTLTPERIKQLNDLNMDWNPKQSQWTSKYLMYKKNKDDATLKYWISTQQTKYQQNTLSQEEIDKLTEVDFPFIPDKKNQNDEIFESNLRILQEFQRNHTKITKSKYPQMWHFIDRQRQLYSKNQLPNQRLQQLRSINFIFDLQKSKWENQYNKLQEFYQQYGHSSPPSSYEDKSLYLFVRKQRENYKNGTLSKDRKIKLESLDFVWNTNDELWNTRFQELQTHYQNFNNCQIKSKDNPQLYAWIRKQKLQYKYYVHNQKEQSNKKPDLKKTTMTPQRIDRLNTLNFPW